MAGFFGKLPAAGDFVARGLPQGVRPVLDRWLTRHLADVAARPADWPEPGLLAAIAGPAGPLGLAMVASHDATGRCFPLAACVSGPTSRAGLEGWAKIVLALLGDARDGGLTADQLYAALVGLPDPDPSDPLLEPPCLWAASSADCALVDPARALSLLFPTIDVGAAP